MEKRIGANYCALCNKYGIHECNPLMSETLRKLKKEKEKMGQDDNTGLVAVYFADGQTKEYSELWEAQAILSKIPDNRLPAAILRGPKVLEVRAKAEPRSALEYR
jgi:hypothetical protein